MSKLPPGVSPELKLIAQLGKKQAKIALLLIEQFANVRASLAVLIDMQAQQMFGSNADAEAIKQQVLQAHQKYFDQIIEGIVENTSQQSDDEADRSLGD